MSMQQGVEGTLKSACRTIQTCEQTERALRHPYILSGVEQSVENDTAHQQENQ